MQCLAFSGNVHRTIAAIYQVQFGSMGLPYLLEWLLLDIADNKGNKRTGSNISLPDFICVKRKENRKRQKERADLDQAAVTPNAFFCYVFPQLGCFMGHHGRLLSLCSLLCHTGQDISSASRRPDKANAAVRQPPPQCRRFGHPLHIPCSVGSRNS